MAPRNFDRRREDDDFDDEDRRRNNRGVGRGYDEREREFLNRSRRRDEGNYGRAYGGGLYQEPDFSRGRTGNRSFDDEDRTGAFRSRFRDDFDDEEGRDGAGYRSQRFGQDDDRFESGRSVGWGRQERQDDETVGRGIRSQARRFDSGGRGFGRYDRDRDDEDDDRPFRSRGEGFGRSFGRGVQDEDYGRRPERGRGREEASDYIGGRHRGSNIGQSQMDYGEQYRRTPSRASRWEDEDVQTTGRLGRQGRSGSVSTFDVEEELGEGRRKLTGRRGTKTTGRGRKSSTAKNRSKPGRSRTTGSTKTKKRKTSEPDQGTGGV